MRGLNIIMMFFLLNSQSEAKLEISNEMIELCLIEQEGDFSAGSCLVLGIIAFKKKEFDLFNRIESLCIEKVRQGLVENDLGTNSFLAYYPRCKYVFEGYLNEEAKNQKDLRLDAKTLVRFLNSLD